MEQEQINNDFNPPHLVQSLSSEHNNSRDKHRTQLNAQKRVKQLSRHIYPNFPPYDTYFNHKQHHITLHKAHPKTYIHGSLYDRQRLCVQRQAMYYRGAVDQYLDGDILKEYIEDSNEGRGYVHKRGNKSVIRDNTLIYAHESTLMAIQLPQMLNPHKLQVHQQSLEPLLIIDFSQGNTILQLQALQNHYFNTVCQGLILQVRFLRKIVIFSVKQRRSLSILQSPSEFIDAKGSIYAKNTIQTMEYDGLATIVSTYQLENKGDMFKASLKNSFKIHGLVNTKININRHESILTKYSGIYSFDNRSNKETLIYHPIRQKLYSSIPLKANYHFSPLIVSCHSRHLSIFDIRKPNQMIKTYPHHSEESPPSIMNFYDGTHSSSLNQPILTCHSPYALGSSMFLPLNLEHFQGLNIQENHQLQYYKQLSKTSYFTLLHDKSKSTKQSGSHRYFNESLSLWNSSPDQFSVFNIDNQANIAIQTFNYNQKNDKYHPREFITQNQTLLNRNITEPNPSQAWLQQTIIKKYFLKSTTYQEQAQIQITNPLRKNKKKSAKKTKPKRKSKPQNKMSQLNESQTQVDLEDFFDGQYQNSSECPESPSKRKVNFADLSQFYSTLQSKALKPQIPTQIKPDNVDFSLSTQANSQGFSFSQSLEIDTGIKALSFHNKKLMNYSILEKLKNEWDN